MKAFHTRHDSTRQPHAKRAAMTRKAQRRDKSARLFLAFAFPADPLPLAAA